MIQNILSFLQRTLLAIFNFTWATLTILWSILWEHLHLWVFAYFFLTANYRFAAFTMIVGAYSMAYSAIQSMRLNARKVGGK